jgi:hypothetical protein
MTIPSTTEEPGNTYRTTWTLTTAQGTGEYLKRPGASDRSVQVFGTFGGATCILEGSNDPRVETAPGSAVWSPLTDASTTAISFTSAGIEAVNENPLYIRPRLSVAGTGASITISLVSKGVR